MSSPIRPVSPDSGSQPLTFFHVAPPSMVLYNPLCVPPPLKPHAVRRRWYTAAYKVLGLFGSIAISVAPVSPFTNRTLCHVLPPSTDLYTPRSLLGPHKWPPAATYTISGFEGCTTTRPIWCVSESPRCTHVVPASILL